MSQKKKKQQLLKFPNSTSQKNISNYSSINSGYTSSKQPHTSFPNPVTLHELTGTPKVIINRNVLNDFDQLHKNPKTRGIEWTGIFFYKDVDEGQVLPNATFEIVDWCLLGIGSSTFVSFDWDNERYIEKTFNNSELRNCKTGWIHTHHSMNTFFSPTDESALSQLAKDKSIAFSLITNARNEHIARVAYSGRRKITSYNHLNCEVETFEDSEDKVYYWNCKVIEKEPVTNSNLNAEIDSILEENAQKNAEKAKQMTYSTVPSITDRSAYQSQLNLQYHKTPVVYINEDNWEVDDVIHDAAIQVVDCSTWNTSIPEWMTLLVEHLESLSLKEFKDVMMWNQYLTSVKSLNAVESKRQFISKLSQRICEDLILLHTIDADSVPSLYDTDELFRYDPLWHSPGVKIEEVLEKDIMKQLNTKFKELLHKTL